MPSNLIWDGEMPSKTVTNAVRDHTRTVGAARRLEVDELTDRVRIELEELSGHVELTGVNDQ